MNFSILVVTIIIFCKLFFLCKTETVNVAWVTSSIYNEKKCLTAAQGKVDHINEKLFVGSEFEAFDVRRNGTYCNSFNASRYLADTLIILPVNAGLLCFKNSTCSAAVLLKSTQFQLNGSDCFAVLAGNYWVEDRTDELLKSTGLGFHVDRIRPSGLSCGSGVHRKLISGDKYSANKIWTQPFGDMWTPIEDIINEAVAEVVDAGTKFTKQITDEVNTIEDSITQQTVVLQNEMQVGTNSVIQALTNKTAQIQNKLDSLEEGLVNDLTKAERYLHLFMHFLELVGGIVILVVAYRLYKKAIIVYSFFKWIGLKLFVRRQKNARPN